MSKARKFAVESFAESLLPVLDSFEAGLAIQEATREQLREGSDATLKQLKSALERHKVVEIAPAAASRFDPHQHQAMMEQPSETVAAGQVIQTLQPGYVLFGRTVRPAMVVVAAKGSGPSPDAGTQAAANAAYAAAGARTQG